MAPYRAEGEAPLWKRWCFLIVGLLLDAFGVALITRADFGVSAVSSFPYTLHEAFPIFTFGVWSYLFQLCLTLVLILTAHRLRLQYILAFAVCVCFGYLLDAACFVTEFFPATFALRCLYYAVGLTFLVFGVCLLVRSELPILPQDLFVRELSRIKGWKFPILKTVFDCLCLAGSVTVGLVFCGRLAGLGVGTVISALIMGKGVGIAGKILDAMHISK